MHQKRRLGAGHWCKSDKAATVSSANRVDDQRKTTKLEKRHITAADRDIHKKSLASAQTFIGTVRREDA